MKSARIVVIKGINDLATLKADLKDLKRHPHTFKLEIAECKEAIKELQKEKKGQ